MWTDFEPLQFTSKKNKSVRNVKKNWGMVIEEMNKAQLIFKFVRKLSNNLRNVTYCAEVIFNKEISK